MFDLNDKVKITEKFHKWLLAQKTFDRSFDRNMIWTVIERSKTGLYWDVICRPDDGSQVFGFFDHELEGQ